MDKNALLEPKPAAAELISTPSTEGGRLQAVMAQMQPSTECELQKINAELEAVANECLFHLADASKTEEDIAFLSGVINELRAGMSQHDKLVDIFIAAGSHSLYAPTCFAAVACLMQLCGVANF